MSEERFARRAAPPSEQVIWRERLREWWGGLAMVVFILAAGAGWFAWRLCEIRDVDGIPEQTARATVAGIKVRDWRGRIGSGFDITLRWQSTSAVAYTTNLSLMNRLKIGDTVAVAYRIGRSGRIVVDDIGEDRQERAPAAPAAR